MRIWGLNTVKSSSQAKGTKSTSFLTCVRNEVDLEALACEDDGKYVTRIMAAQVLFHCIKGTLLSKALTFSCINKKWPFYQGHGYLWLYCGHLTQITLCPNIQLLSIRHHDYQSFLSYFLVLVWHTL